MKLRILALLLIGSLSLQSVSCGEDKLISVEQPPIKVVISESTQTDFPESLMIAKFHLAEKKLQLEEERMNIEKARLAFEKSRQTKELTELRAKLTVIQILGGVEFVDGDTTDGQSSPFKSLTALLEEESEDE
ncbi:MAG TPA: hypothetical protein QGF02_02760 [Candidatus Babeliales bacterium]|nr:hypothetical protein [Candidatus Babeliales bacterium]